MLYHCIVKPEDHSMCKCCNTELIYTLTLDTKTVSNSRHYT
uniref:Uncharacterized protein n=1 Tax=Anguilla anguilla TaxID=7936 RepID=A0A0E9TQE3_ANGAN